MYKVGNLGWMVLVAITLMMTACAVAPNTAPKAEETAAPQVQPTVEQLPEQGQPQQEQGQEQEPVEGQPPTAREAAATVMRAIKNSDMQTVAAWVHAKKGIRFSPYAYVDVESDLTFKQDTLNGLMEDSKTYVWGTSAGSGEPIHLTYADYYKQFVYDADFAKDGTISLNEVQGKSTTTNNLNEVYPKESYDFVEYYIDGIDPAVEGMDWRSLRLVFEKIGDDRALVGIIHDQWTP
ncbi:hypothetical protein [Paenibacillus sp. FSL H8-0537]|uniref:hypothetical protein n=1 Tax=Paenibacillus sp. FSL H8-0537 TaxID=2921399 RepID=UPI003100DADA